MERTTCHPNRMLTKTSSPIVRHPQGGDPCCLTEVEVLRLYIYIYLKRHIAFPSMAAYFILELVLLVTIYLVLLSFSGFSLLVPTAAVTYSLALVTNSL